MALNGLFCAVKKLLTHSRCPVCVLMMPGHRDHFFCQSSSSKQPVGLPLVTALRHNKTSSRRPMPSLLMRRQPTPYRTWLNILTMMTTMLTTCTETLTSCSEFSGSSFFVLYFVVLVLIKHSDFYLVADLVILCVCYRSIWVFFMYVSR